MLRSNKFSTIALSIFPRQECRVVFILTDKRDQSIDLQLQNRSWKPVASEIVRAGIIFDDRAQTLAYHLCTEVTSAEAATISKHLGRRLRENSLPHDIDSKVAELIVHFAAASSGFEVC